MINYETILSTFDDKLTLLQWLQKVEQALEGAGLESVEIHQQSPTTAYFKFVFADGTSVTTPSITLPRGPKGDTGAEGATGATGNGIASITKTGTSGLVDTYTILYTNGSTQTFTVTNGADGADGADGTSITGVSVNSSNHLICTLSNGATIDAGEIQKGYNVVEITSNSGTLSQSDLDKVKLRGETAIIHHISANWYNILYYQFETGTTLYYQSIYYSSTSPKLLVCLYAEIDIATGAYTVTSTNKPITASSIDSESATNGQVLTANGNGGVSWQTPSGGSQLYMHNITYEKTGSASSSNSPFTVLLTIVNTSSSQISISDFKTLLSQTGTISCTGVGTWRSTVTRILFGITYISATDKIRVVGYEINGQIGYEDANVYTNLKDTVIAL